MPNKINKLSSLQSNKRTNWNLNWYSLKILSSALAFSTIHWKDLIQKNYSNKSFAWFLNKSSLWVNLFNESDESFTHKSE